MNLERLAPPRPPLTTAGFYGGALAFTSFDSVYWISITSSTFLNNSVSVP